jgi:hypothetical protein
MLGLLACFVATGVHASEINLSFYGYQFSPAGCYSESADSVLVLDLLATHGPELQGSIHYFGLLSRNHSSVGCGYPDSNSDPGCSGYDITAWFEPGGVPVGHVDGAGDQNAQLAGNEWLGHVPTDFTHIRVQFQAGSPCEADARELMIPVSWLTQPLPTRSVTWGRVKSLFR